MGALVFTMSDFNQRLKHLAAAINLNTPSRRAAVLRAIECGHDLREAKALVGHGNWAGWLKENTEVSQRRAQVYMMLAEKVPRTDAGSVRQAVEEVKNAT